MHPKYLPLVNSGSNPAADGVGKEIIAQSNSALSNAWDVPAQTCRELHAAERLCHAALATEMPRVSHSFLLRALVRLR